LIRVTLGCSILVSVLACSGTSGQTLTAQQIQKELDESFGGYDTGTEKPNFGNDAMLAIPSLATTYASQPAPAGSSSPTRSYRIALLWGHLPAANADSDSDSDAAPGTWIGSVSLDAGAIEVVRTLSLDDGDSVAPRTTPLAVAFVSHTLPFVDGLLLHLKVTGDRPDAVLHFVTDTLTTDLQLQIIADGPGVVVHASGDQGLAAVGWNDTAGACPGGVMYGRFVKIHGAVGTMRARVIAADGTDTGFGEGIWGHAPGRDSDVFFGKTIDAAGAFAGLFEGVYSDGTLHGTFGDAMQSGSFAGVYSDGFDERDGRGVFVAKWMPYCAAH
jgi:hypothetical protein